MRVGQRDGARERQWVRAFGRISLLGALLAVTLLAGATALHARVFGGGHAIAMELPPVSADRPLTILVRGWLVDPTNRADSGPLSIFPREVNRALEARGIPASEFVQYDWSRVPKDLLASADAFETFARDLTTEAAVNGRCVSFVGHSAGAMMVYRAAAEGVPMGFMGTIGLPTPTAGHPGSVDVWGNFYSHSYISDLPEALWGPDAEADINLDLSISHKDMWQSNALASAAADGIAHAWSSCHPSDQARNP
jgi:hypothetical protein